MTPVQLFRDYEFLADKADTAFEEMKKDYADCIRCELHCSDCCHAVFGLFVIEAAYLKQHFDHLEREKIREALLRCNDMERALKRLEIRLRKYEEDPRMQSHIMATERIRCPLLDENQECILYLHRPITCRVYGIPTKIQGKAHVCGKAGFERGKSYPAFDLDGVYKDLFHLSKELLESAERGNPDKASLLVSVSSVISTSFDHLINENFG